MQRVLLVGCEPGLPVPTDDLQMELSEPVRRAVEQAAGLIESLVTRIRADISLAEETVCTSFPSH